MGAEFRGLCGRGRPESHWPARYHIYTSASWYISLQMYIFNELWGRAVLLLVRRLINVSRSKKRERKKPIAVTVFYMFITETLRFQASVPGAKSYMSCPEYAVFSRYGEPGLYRSPALSRMHPAVCAAGYRDSKSSVQQNLCSLKGVRIPEDFAEPFSMIP